MNDDNYRILFTSRDKSIGGKLYVQNTIRSLKLHLLISFKTLSTVKHKSKPAKSNIKLES